MWTRWPGYLRWYITYNWVIVCYLLPITPKQHLIFNATEIAPIIYVSVSCNIPQNISNKKNAKPKSSCLVDCTFTANSEFPWISWDTRRKKSYFRIPMLLQNFTNKNYQPSKTDHGPTAAEFGNFLALPRRDLVCFCGFILVMLVRTSASFFHRFSSCWFLLQVRCWCKIHVYP